MSRRKRNPGYDTSGMEILFDRSEGELDRDSVGGTITKTIRSGAMLEVECFPCSRRGKRSEAVAEVTRRVSTPAQARLNQKNTQKKVHRLLEANFSPKDIVGVLTWDYGQLEYARMNGGDIEKTAEKIGLPTDADEAKHQTKLFLQRVKRLFRRKGGDPTEFKWLYVVEMGKEPRDEDPHPIRKFHVHLAFSGQGLDRDLVEALWPFGHGNMDRVQVYSGGLARIANYITKQRHTWRRWAHSQNLKNPRITRSRYKVSPGKLSRLAVNVRVNANEIFEKLYPGYVLDEWPTVSYSDFVAGAYIYARLRRRD